MGLLMVIQVWKQILSHKLVSELFDIGVADIAQ